MKNTTAKLVIGSAIVLLSLGLNTPLAHAKKAASVKYFFQLNCKVPDLFAGIASSANGKIDLLDLKNGTYKAQGNIELKIHDARSPQTFQIDLQGIFDSLNTIGGGYMTAGGKLADGREVSLFANFSNPETSYIEIDSDNGETQMLPTECYSLTPSRSN